MAAEPLAHIDTGGELIVLDRSIGCHGEHREAIEVDDSAQEREVAQALILLLHASPPPSRW